MRFYRQQDFGDPPGSLTARDLQLHGCGCAACINALVFASGGRWRPKGRNGAESAAIRVDRSGASDVEFVRRGLTSREVFASLQSIIATDVRMDVPVKAYHGERLTVQLDKMVDVGGCLLVAVKNRVLAKAGKSPFPDFYGGHWGVVIGRPNGSQVEFVDSGRKAPIRLPIELLADAMGAFGDNRDVGLSDQSWGDGRGEGIAVWPWLTWREGYAVVDAKLAAARAQRDVARSALAECQAAGPGVEAIAAARAKGIADAAAAAAAVK